jgi:hypothetical protein
MNAPVTAARHSCDSPEWYTPSPIVEASRKTMGGIDLDPASHAEAADRIGALRYFDEADNGLEQPWHGRVFLNPPGGLVAAFWIKMLRELTAGRMTQAVWVGYSLEQLQTLQSQASGWDSPLAFPMCVPRARLAFIENEAKRQARIEKLIAAGKTPHLKSSPSHGNYITYVGPHTGAFISAFSPLGQVRA